MAPKSNLSCSEDYTLFHRMFWDLIQGNKLGGGCWALSRQAQGCLMNFPVLQFTQNANPGSYTAETQGAA